MNYYTIVIKNISLSIYFRDKLGLEEDDTVNVTGVLIKYKKQKKALQSAQLKLSKLENENVALKMKVQDLNRKNVSLNKQVARMDGAPDESTSISDKGHLVKQFENTEEEMKLLAEENEALRKGLHEILESLRKKNGTIIIVFQLYL